MSYAGKTSRGRRTVRDGSAAREAISRASAREPLTAPRGRLGEREVALGAAPLSPGRRPPTVQAEELELDWQRLAIFAGGALLGVAVGAGAALLLAPQSGEATRRDLLRRGRRFGVRTADAWEDLRDELRWAARRGRRQVGRALRDRRRRREPED